MPTEFLRELRKFQQPKYLEIDLFSPICFCDGGDHDMLPAWRAVGKYDNASSLVFYGAFPFPLYEKNWDWSTADRSVNGCLNLITDIILICKSAFPGSILRFNNDRRKMADIDEADYAFASLLQEQYFEYLEKSSFRQIYYLFNKKMYFPGQNIAKAIASKMLLNGGANITVHLEFGESSKGCAYL